MTAQMVDCIGLLAQQECPRCRQGFCTETDERCSLIEQDERSFQAGSLDCAYFADCVMPADWTLTDLVALRAVVCSRRGLTQRRKTCRQKYKPMCSWRTKHR